MYPLRNIADDMPDVLRQAFGPDNMNASELAQVSLHQTISEWQRHPRDTGSSAVQVAVMTERIKKLAAHMKQHHKDSSTKRRVIMLVLKRNRMLKYMRRTQRSDYHRVIESCGIRPTRNFDPTVGVDSMTKWSNKGPYTPRKRKPRAKPYGLEKTAKGRNQLRKHANRQRRLQRARDQVLQEEKRAAAAEERRAKAAAYTAAASPAASAATTDAGLEKD